MRKNLVGTMINPCWLHRRNGEKHYALLLAKNGQVLARTIDYGTDAALYSAIGRIATLAGSPIRTHDTPRAGSHDDWGKALGDDLARITEAP